MTAAAAATTDQFLIKAAAINLEAKINQATRESQLSSGSSGCMHTKDGFLVVVVVVAQQIDG